MLAQTLGLSMTAEGIEEPMDIVPAFSIGCDAMQGFGISPPLSSEGLAIFVAGWVTRPWWNAVSTTRVHP
jgi:EAL domain-containing protein (putative c-di-GMP-specific phosphodiesterase class I)